MLTKLENNNDEVDIIISLSNMGDYVIRDRNLITYKAHIKKYEKPESYLYINNI